MAAMRQLAERNSIRAFRAGPYVLIVANGTLPNPGFKVDIVPNVAKIFPQQFDLTMHRLPGMFPEVRAPYVYAETTRFPVDQTAVTVHHADGTDRVDIEDCGKDLAGYLRAITGSTPDDLAVDIDMATGFSKRLSFDEAFGKAVANLPPAEVTVADALQRIEIVEMGALFGGVAGFHDVFVRVRRVQDA
jgi:hypothetical protein